MDTIIEKKVVELLQRKQDLNVQISDLNKRKRKLDIQIADYLDQLNK